MKITKAVVLMHPCHCDNVFLHTELPGAMWPFDENLTASFEAAKNTGAEYVRKNFGIEPEIINRLDE